MLFFISTVKNHSPLGGCGAEATQKERESISDHSDPVGVKHYMTPHPIVCVRLCEPLKLLDSP